MLIQKLRTPLGVFRATVSPHGVKELLFPENGKTNSLQREGLFSSSHGFPSYKRLLSKVLRSYFSGKSPKSPSISHIPLDWSQYSYFEKKVLRACTRIPFGKTMTYGDLAKKVSCPGGARAVGNALGRNRVPILVPCHRVVRSDRTLGGYTAGKKWKRTLLDLERGMHS